MSKYQVGEIVYCDINERSARKCQVVAWKRKTYLLKALDTIGDGILIKRNVKDLWKLSNSELVAQPQPEKSE